MATIVCIADGLSQMQVVTGLLERQNHQVTLATSSAAAMDYLIRQTPDLIILDVAMQAMDGLMFLEILRADRLWRQVPVLIFTASADERRRRHAQALGVQGYLRRSEVSIWDIQVAISRCGVWGVAGVKGAA